MRILSSLLLVGVTVVRGWTFVVLQSAIVLYSVLGFLAGRFVLAAAALAPYGVQDLASDPHGRRGCGARSGSGLQALVARSCRGSLEPFRDDPPRRRWPGRGEPGDALTLLCAAALGLHIALLSRYAAEFDASGLAFVQMLAVALVFGVSWPFFEPVAFSSREVWPALAATGLGAPGAFWYKPSFSSAAGSRREAVASKG